MHALISGNRNKVRSGDNRWVGLGYLPHGTVLNRFVPENASKMVSLFVKFSD